MCGNCKEAGHPTKECPQPKKEGSTGEGNWKKGKHVTIQEEERRDRDVHIIQHTKFKPFRDDRLDEEVSVVTTRSRKPLLKQQDGSSTERFNEQHSDVETSLSEYSQGPLIRAPKDKPPLVTSVPPTNLIPTPPPDNPQTPPPVVIVDHTILVE